MCPKGVLSHLHSTTHQITFVSTRRHGFNIKCEIHETSS